MRQHSPNEDSSSRDQGVAIALACEDNLPYRTTARENARQTDKDHREEVPEVLRVSHGLIVEPGGEASRRGSRRRISCNQARGAHKHAARSPKNLPTRRHRTEAGERQEEAGNESNSDGCEPEGVRRSIRVSRTRAKRHQL